MAGPGQGLELSREEQHYLRRVLRLRPGEAFAISDGQGQLWQGHLGAEGQALQGQLLEHQAAPQPRLVLLAGLMRRELEPMLRMVTELGLDRFVPLRAQRSLPDPGDQRQDRWQTLVKEACEQCERLWQPQLEAVVSAVRPWHGPGRRGNSAGSPLPGKPGCPACWGSYRRFRSLAVVIGSWPAGRRGAGRQRNGTLLPRPAGSR